LGGGGWRHLAPGACALDAAVHAWDIAMGTGQKSPLTAPLAGWLMTVATSIVEPLRGYGAYKAAIGPDAADDEVAYADALVTEDDL